MPWQSQAWTGLQGSDSLLLRQTFSSLTEHLGSSAHAVYVPLKQSAAVAYVVPVAVGEVGTGENRTFVDARYFSTFRWYGNLSAGTGLPASKLRLQYTTDLTGAGGWTTMDTATDVSANGGAHVLSATGTVPSLAKTDILLRLAGHSGNGVATATILYMGVELLPTLP